MVIIRNTFIAKPGLASKLARQLKDATSVISNKARVLTDLTGDFNRVILELEADTIAGFEEAMKEYGTNAEFRAKMAGYTDLWQSGSREILSVVE